MSKNGAVVLLAAGSSSRMGQPKALLRWGKLTFVQHLCQTLDELNLDCRGVVTRAEMVPRLQVSWPLWVHPRPEEGMLSSLQLALGQISPQSQWLLVSLVDQPAIRPSTFITMAAQARTQGWAYPTYQGRRGHPVVIGRSCFASLLAAAPGLKPREALSGHPHHPVEIDDPGLCLDFDTQEEWKAYQQALGMMA